LFAARGYSRVGRPQHEPRNRAPLRHATIWQISPARQRIVEYRSARYVAIDYQLHAMARQMTKPLVIALLLACVAPAAAALAQTPMPTIAITLRDHRFAPQDVPAPSGVKVRLLVHNAQAIPAEFESSSLHREKIVTPGATISVLVGPLDPGSYEFFDDFHSATRGHLVVK
jgi:hypothetical protein